MNFTIEKVANMIVINSGDVVWKAWDESEFTERKLAMAMKKIMSGCGNHVVFNRKF